MLLGSFLYFWTNSSYISSKPLDQKWAQQAKKVCGSPTTAPIRVWTDAVRVEVGHESRAELRRGLPPEGPINPEFPCPRDGKVGRWSHVVEGGSAESGTQGICRD